MENGCISNMFVCLHKVQLSEDYPQIHLAARSMRSHNLGDRGKSKRSEYSQMVMVVTIVRHSTEIQA